MSVHGVRWLSKRSGGTMSPPMSGTTGKNTVIMGVTQTLLEGVDGLLNVTTRYYLLSISGDLFCPYKNQKITFSNS